MLLYLGGHQPEGAGALSEITSDCVCAHGALGNFTSLGTSNAIPPLTVRRNSPVKGKPGWGAPNLPIPRGLDRCIGLRHLQLKVGSYYHRKKPVIIPLGDMWREPFLLACSSVSSSCRCRVKLDRQFHLPLGTCSGHVHMAVHQPAAASRQLLGVTYFSL